MSRAEDIHQPPAALAGLSERPPASPSELIDELIEARLAGGELERRRELIKAVADGWAQPPPLALAHPDSGAIQLQRPRLTLVGAPGGEAEIPRPARDASRRPTSATTVKAETSRHMDSREVGGTYILEYPIGQGATGTVWRGLDRSSGEPVAIKLLHESLLRQPKLVTRFVQERTILLMLRHRNVVRVRDLFSVGHTLGLVMDLVDGGSLRDHLRAHRTLPASEAVRITGQVAEALAEAHELGVVHRDVKPDNILLRLGGGPVDARLADFGIARIFDDPRTSATGGIRRDQPREDAPPPQDNRPQARLIDFSIARILGHPGMTTPNAVVGTPHYMAPETFHGATASPAADVYALGVVLYELLTGRTPYDSDSIADLMGLHLAGNLPRPIGIPKPLWNLIMRCMADKPRRRPTSADLADLLADLAHRFAREAPTPEPGKSPIPWARDLGSDPLSLGIMRHRETILLTMGA